MLQADIGVFNWLIILTFVLGYSAITIEHTTKINKTSVALLMGILCWVFQFFNHIESRENNLNYLAEHLANISQVIFFLWGALSIVEIVSAHKGFHFISNSIRIRSKRKLLWSLSLIAFFLSAILDNLTTTIIMVTLLRKLVEKSEDRLIIGGAIVIAANAGGAWTPIGDVTTTMLWIGGQLSTVAIMQNLFLPSVACFVASLIVLSLSLKGEFSTFKTQQEDNRIEPMGIAIFILGLGCLIFVPIFKIVTGLPPFMGIIFGLGILWLFTDIAHSRNKNREHLLVPNILMRVDLSGVLFFLGILLCIDALHTAGLLHQLANGLDQTIGRIDMIAIAIGLISAVIDNVPLVAAAMGMYGLEQYPLDSNFWNLIAYCAGTGGSILIIGSAAGVAFMGLENVQFFWYMRRVGVSALIGYFTGIGVLELLIK